MKILYFFAAGLTAGTFGYHVTKNRIAALTMFASWPLIYMRGRSPEEAAISALFINLLLTVSMIDMESLIIPNRYVLAITLISLPEFILETGPGWWERLAGAAASGILLAFVLIIGGRGGKSVLGWGDVKLSAACGLMLGWRLALLSLFAACLTASLGITALGAFRKAPESGTPLPFAPAIAVGAAICRLWGTELLSLILPG